jgi:hypothetical protein
MELDEDKDGQTKVIGSLTNHPNVKDDEFWKTKLSTMAAERALDNCMEAVMSGEVDDIDACLMDAANDTLLEDCWVGRCRLPVSKLVLKGPMNSALEARM